MIRGAGMNAMGRGRSQAVSWDAGMGRDLGLWARPISTALPAGGGRNEGLSCDLGLLHIEGGSTAQMRMLYRLQPMHPADPLMPHSAHSKTQALHPTPCASARPTSEPTARHRGRVQSGRGAGGRSPGRARGRTRRRWA